MIDHIGLLVSVPARSRAFYDAALAPLGYRVLMEIPTQYTDGKVVLGYGVPPKPGAPGPRPHYHEKYYGAFVLDPDGHNVEAVCHT